jgi:hypothetical protein
MNNPVPLTALALVCTLNPSPAESSSELIAQQLLGELARHDVTGTSVRVVDHDVKDLSETPEATASATATAAANAAHLARLLRGRGYPPVR